MIADSQYPKISLEHAHVLVIDDQEAIRNRVVQALEKDPLFTKTTVAEDGLIGFQKLLQADTDIDVVLCDVEMPQIDGFKFLNLKSSKPELASIPVIMLTTRGEIENKLKGLEYGASDYLLKPFDEAELLARTKIQLRIRRMMEALRRQAKELENISNTDALTRVSNRRFLMRSLDSAFEKSKEASQDLACIICDIDHFKSINDEYGHQMGDSVLIEVAATLRKQARDHDVVARYGGEEFCLVLPDADPEIGRLCAERCREAIAGLVFKPRGKTLDIRASFGVASRLTAGAATAEDLLRAADVSLYKAKQQGRNRTIVYEAS